MLRDCPLSRYGLQVVWSENVKRLPMSGMVCKWSGVKMLRDCPCQVCFASGLE